MSYFRQEGSRGKERAPPACVTHFLCVVAYAYVTPSLDHMCFGAAAATKAAAAAATAAPPPPTSLTVFGRGVRASLFVSWLAVAEGGGSLFLSVARTVGECCAV